MARKSSRGGSSEEGPLRVLGYVRVSTDEQATSGAGLVAQRQAIEDAARHRGYELVEILSDEGWSGKSLERPGIVEAIRRLDEGQVSALVVSKLDRLSRSLLDFASLMERGRQRGWAIVALDLGVDTTTPSGELMANVLATFAQFERRLISERTKVAMAVKKAQGVHVGRPKSVSPELIERITEDRRLGLTLQQICDQLEGDGVPTPRGGERWYTSVVWKILASASYG